MDADTICTLVIGVLLSFIIIGIIITVFFASTVDKTNKIVVPDDIDVIIIERGRQRAQLQIDMIQKHMSWVHRIIVVKIEEEDDEEGMEDENEDEGENKDNPKDKKKDSKKVIPISRVTYRSRDEDVIQDVNDSIYDDYRDAHPSEKQRRRRVLMNLPLRLRSLYPGIKEDIICLGDTTIPIRNFTPRDMWSVSHRKRVFNYVQPDARALGLQRFIEPTIPVSLFHLDTIEEAGSLDVYLLTMSLAENIVYSPTINKSVIFTSNEFADTHQLKMDTSTEAFFLTGLISPELDGEIQQRLNTNVTKLFNGKT